MITRSTSYSQIKGLVEKLPCRVATTASITLSGTQTIDGVALSVDDRVLVKDQGTTNQNGVYLVKSGAWERSIDSSTTSDFFQGISVFILQGTANQNKKFFLSTSGDVIVGTTGLTFNEVPGGSASISDGDKGDITVSNSGATWTIDNDVVTFAKMQDINTNKLLGRYTASSGDIEEVSLSNNLRFSGGSLLFANTLVFDNQVISIGSTDSVRIVSRFPSSNVNSSSFIQTLSDATSGSASFYSSSPDATAYTTFGLVTRNTDSYFEVDMQCPSINKTAALTMVLDTSPYFDVAIDTVRLNGNTVINGTLPHSSSILDINSTTKGLLIPRMTTTERNAISTPAAGLTIYNTTNNTFDFYSSSWRSLIDNFNTQSISGQKTFSGSTNFNNAIFHINNNYSSGVYSLLGSSSVGFSYLSQTTGITLSTNASYAQHFYNSISLTEAGTGTHNLISVIGVKSASITQSSASITNAATIYVEGAATGTATITNNYALWIDDGVVRLDGELELQGIASATKSDVMYYDSTTKRLSYGAAPSGGVTDGDKGDITVSGSGATWLIDQQAVTFDKIQNIDPGSILGRFTPGIGETEIIQLSGNFDVSTGTLVLNPYTRQNISAATHNETAVSGKKILFVDTTSNNVTINLPTAVGNTAEIIIKRTSAGTNTITVDANSTETIDGGLTAIIRRQYESITLVSDNANWWII